MSDITDQAPLQASGAVTLDLRQFCEQVGQAKQQALRLVERLDDQAFEWRPGPGRWSIAECLEHLNVTLELYFPGMDEAIQTARARGWRCDKPPRPGFLGRWLISALEPTATRRLKAPRIFHPQKILPLAEAIPRFMHLRQELEKRLRDAEGLDLQRAKLRSPALSLLRFNLGETFAIVTTHDRRHLWQAEQVRQSPGFPQP
jgi:hypothetical protein